ncbi:2-oxo acid dehydrogenase subunit E2 [Mycetocola manganoxydans]|uniref:Dihydrolipoamide acetyltransferase component of pyruvate dehydrogenase complex n=1 Tax=Mycetocola manganoxydans TaxID=699879 RepID=A0A3L6ZZC8_9MICO|nr:dihydrolipoamide acetyltransferase family protein [Mycetocola manganoxydans]RLP73070.1 2-oxo acid dehydrogenase subunit E2 [Mycetocola manganoxydans]GHD44234.1 dihydrolipoamide acetyltransferase component of pyruvate dehydrogenase complex [Mycetocola manganoxydans]
MSEFQFLMPDAGEGLTEAEVVSWRVAPGDTVELNQVLLEIETAKSLVELPSPYEGTVSAILVEEGTTVDVGTPIITISAAADETELGAPATAAVGPSDVDAEAAEAVADTRSSIDEEKSGAVLVGYGNAGAVTSRRRRARTDAAPPAAQAASAPTPSGPVIAKPPIRKLAKDLGVDLRLVAGTGIGGEVTRDDVVREAGQASVFRNIETPDWAETREDRIPVKGVRKQIANAMVESAFKAPHVSLFVDVDATRTMEFIKRLKNSTDFAGVKVSPLLIMAKAMIWAVRRNPTVNATWTDDEIIVRHYVNFGVAAATPRGLIVPNVKEAQSMSLLQLAQSLEQLTLTARDGKTPPADQQGGTITVTNIGVFGMDTGTPILNPGEVAIVALGTIKQKPWVVDGEVRPRFVTTLGASFDHRVVDGDVASRFLADVASIIEEPALLLD